MWRDRAVRLPVSVFSKPSKTSYSINPTHSEVKQTESPLVAISELANSSSDEDDEFW